MTINEETLAVLNEDDEPRRRRWPWVVALLALVGVGAGAGTYGWYYHDRALPGTSIAGVSVSGQKAAQISADLNQKFAALPAELKLKDKVIKANYADLGVTLDSAAVAQNAVTKSSWNRYLTPWKKQQIPTPVKINQEKLQAFLNEKLGEDALKGKPAEVNLKEDATGFEVKPAVPGERPDTEKLVKPIETAAQQLKGVNLDVEITKKEPSFNTQTAQALADSANKQFNTEVVLVGANRSFAPDPLDRKDFFNIEPQNEGGFKLVLKDEAVTQWVDKIASELHVTPRNGVQKILADGQKVGEPSEKRDGREVANRDDLQKQVLAAFRDSTPVNAEVKFKELPAEIINKVVEPEPKPAEASNGGGNANAAALPYSPAEGEKWIDVNLTRHTATAYQGTKVVYGPIAMVNGKPDTPTVEGIFPVWAKVRSQTMRGPDYVTPGVPWILYFHGDYALHGAPWRSHFGHAGRGGSHGCVNLPVDVAKWFYHWAPMGTKVVSHR
ncbi:hypothetical protein BSR28_08500 [Boudabousia liubingyangii]|uniref:L,D-transpeptidase family protein n=1 Tax=Boudabousia liubingyangii TaxID=1921764 RepID=UPI00093AC758|nr:L,D-transpeptidase family protein [Boudabousia liubingyangii]OKL46089.1 hypothetical protein BSR28_08500 [Boudabousia liubingyangii]